MPVELDFWAESLSRSYRNKDVIGNNSSDNHDQNTPSRTFSIFEDR